MGSRNQSFSFSRGWQLTKSSFKVLKLDKELVLFPFLNMVAVLALLIAGSILLLSSSGFFDAGYDTNTLFADGYLGYVVLFLFYILTSFIATYFGAAIIHGALRRFRGEDPNIKSSLAAANKQIVSIAVFSLFSGTLGYLLNFIENRVPFGGKVLTWLAGLAWGIASFFAIPIIVTSDEYTSPISATKKSIDIMKKAWGDSLVSQISVGAVTFVLTLAYVAVIIPVVIILFGFNSAIGLGITVIGLFGLVGLSLVFSALGSIVQAAVYHYATTGESPAQFDKELMKSAMTPKKAKKIFA